MVTRTLPQYETEPYRVSLDKKEGSTIVSLEAANGGGHTLPLETNVVSENGEQIATNTKLVAPGKYELSIPDSSGMYFLNVKQTDQTGNLHVYQTGFTVPYSEEYLLKGANKELLKELVSVTGGKELSRAEESFRETASKNFLKQPISQWLILLAFLLFLVEITVRRFGTRRLFGWLQRKRVEPVGGTSRVERLPVRQKSVANSETVVVAVEGADSVIAPVESKAKVKRPKPVEKTLTAEEKEERMRRLLDARKRKN
jgi:Ca-activated chloride channel homolog